jgi:hypothetical protein
MKNIDEMTEAEIDAELLKLSGQTKPIEQMSEEEIDMELGIKKPEEKELKVLNEPADISWKDRIVLKNFGGDIPSQVNYLKSQKKYKDFDISSDEDGIIAKKKGESAYKKLDPPGVTSPLEAAKDITDVGYDLASAVGTGLATTSAGLAGGLSSFGLGAVPSAAAAGGAASGGFEYLKQKIGQGLGASGKTNLADIGVATALGALPIAALGTGATKSMAAKAISKPGAAEKFLVKADLPMFFDEAGKLSAESKELATKEFIDKQKGFLKGAGGKLTEWFTGAGNSKDIADALDNTPSKVIDDLIANGVGLNPQGKYTNQEIVKVLNNQGAMGEFGQTAANTAVDALQNNKMTISREIEGNIPLDKSFELTQYGNKLEDVVDEGMKSKTEAGLALADKAKEILRKYFRETELPIDAEGKIIRARGGQRPVYVNVKEFQSIQQQLKDIADVAANPMVVDTKDITTKRLRQDLMDASQRMSDDFWDAIPDESLKGRYAKYKSDFRALEKYFRTPESAAKLMSNINNKSNRILKEKITKFDKDYKTNLMDLTKIANTAKIFGDDSLQAVSTKGTTSTSKLLNAQEAAGTMAYMGGLASGIPGAAQAASALGRGSAGLITSPRAVSSYMSGATFLNRLGEQAMSKIPQPIQAFGRGAAELQQKYPWTSAPIAAQSAWQLMGGR